MGLFDKKKKEQNLEADSAKEIKLEDSDVTATLDNSERFSVVIAGVTSMLDGNGSIVSGVLTGKIKKGDNVFVYQPGLQVYECEVQAIEAKLQDKTSIVDEAEDTTVSLQLTLPDDAKVGKYAVITNIKPQEKVDPKVSIENPALAGIINGMRDFGKENNYHATLAYWLSHGHFITPIKMDIEPELNENGVAMIKKNTKIGFYMLKSQVKLEGTPEDKDSMVLPLFTDWDSLRKWKGLTEKNQKVHTQILSFQDLYSILKRGDAYNGIAVNPFNKIPCTLPIPYLDTIVSTPGYQKEFAPKSVPNDQLREEKIPQGKRILLGVPKEGEESTQIREALVEYGKSHEDIQSMSFLTKVEEDAKIIRHLIVLEFPENFAEDDMKKHMEAIYKEIAPLTKEIKQIEYAIKGRIPAIDGVVAENADKMVVYTR